jgi:hypothetical protein
MSASSATTLATPTAAYICEAVERSWQKRTRLAERSGQTFSGEDMANDVLDELAGHGMDTSLYTTQQILAELVRSHLLLEDMSERVLRERDRGNVIPMRRKRERE